MSVRGLVLEDMGRQAAREFLDRQVPLNDTILKMAQAEGLNAESVKRVCETANVAVDNHLFDSFQKAAMEGGADLFYPKFPLADASAVVARLGGVPKTAAVEHRIWDDYDRPPMLEIRSTYDPLAEAALEKVAAEQPEPPARLDVAMEKLGALRAEVLMRKAGSELMIDGCIDRCYQHIKQQVLGGSDIKSLYRAASSKQKTPEGKQRVRDVFQYAAEKLVDQGVRITEDRQALKLAYPALSKGDCEKYITDLFETPEGAGQVLVLNGSYVNDTHPLFSELNTLIRQYDEADRYDKALVVIDDKVKYVKEKVRGMTFGGA